MDIIILFNIYIFNMSEMLMHCLTSMAQIGYRCVLFVINLDTQLNVQSTMLIYMT